jgi:hypothetical protein
MARPRRSAIIALGLLVGVLVAGALDTLTAGPGVAVVFGIDPAAEVLE